MRVRWSLVLVLLMLLILVAARATAVRAAVPSPCEEITWLR